MLLHYQLVSKEDFMVRYHRGLLLIILILLISLLVGWSFPSPAPSAVPPLALTPGPTPTPAATDDEVSFVPSPDNRWTAVINTTTGSLDLQQPDGQTINIFPPGSTVNTVTWSPDSRHLLAVRTNWVFNEPEGTGVESSGPIEIWHIPVGTAQAKPAVQLYHAESEGDGAEGPEQILFGQWSPNSEHIPFWLGPLGASILADGLAPFTLDVTTGEATRLADWALTNPRYHTWAPDSSALALTAGEGRSAQVNKWLVVFEPASGQVSTVISQTEQIPGIVVWSPKGDLVAYAAVPTEETGEEWADLMTFDNPAIAGRRIYLLDPATGQSHRLNNNGSFQDAPVWNEDGTVLYYAQRQGNQLQVMAADPKTGQASAVPGAAIPLPEFVGYYGQSDLEALMAQRPGGAFGVLPASQATPTTASAPPSEADLAAVRFVLERHRPELGTLTEEFLEGVAQGAYTDFTRQEVDLTGDGQPEILVSGNALSYHLFVAILRRTSDGALEELFYTASNEAKYFAQVETTVDSNRVIADFLTYNGGTGYLEMTWEQRWIECQPQQCDLVWSSPRLVADRSVHTAIERNYAVSEIDTPDDQNIRLTTHRFGLSIPTIIEGGSPPGTARRFIGPDMVESYRRTTADVYQLESQVQTDAGLEIAREFSQETLETNRLVYEITSQPFFGADGLFDSEGFNQMWAEVWDLPPQGHPEDPVWGHSPAQAEVAAHTGTPDQLGEWLAGMIGATNTPQCRLVIQRQAAGKFEVIGRIDLPCTINFSRLAWTDVTGDGLEELLLITIPPEVEAGGQLQRLYLYTVAGDQLLELATLDGFINGPDGVGIRWENDNRGFRVEAGLPLVDLDSYPTLDQVSLTRRFQVYTWNDQSKRFQPVE
jgi:hypothetical protein